MDKINGLFFDPNNSFTKYLYFCIIKQKRMQALLESNLNRDMFVIDKNVNQREL